MEGVYAVLMHSARGLDRHWHGSYGFGVMDEGGHASASGRGPVHAVAGDVITVNPGEVHDGTPLSSRPRRWRMIHVSPETMAAMLAIDGHEFTRPVLDDPSLRAAIDHVFRCWNDVPPALGGGTAHALWEEALANACGLLAGRHGNRRLDDNPKKTRLDSVRECLLDRMDAPPALAELADLAGLSRFQLVRQFAKDHGLPPFAWLRQHRLGRAQALIAQGTPLGEAAAACGFADQSHLHRLFSRALGFTPGAWRSAWLQSRSRQA